MGFNKSAFYTLQTRKKLHTWKKVFRSLCFWRFVGVFFSDRVRKLAVCFDLYEVFSAFLEKKKGNEKLIYEQ